MVLRVNLVEFFPIKESDDYVINQDGVILRLSQNCFITTSYVKTYPRVNLVFNGKRVTRAIHRLLAEVFIPAIEGKEFVNHLNGDKQDYRLENLEWCTRSENMLHSTHVLGNPKPPNHKGRTGKLCKHSKPVVATCGLTGVVLIFESARDAARVSGGKFHTYGIAQSIKGNYENHRGYHWSLLEECNV